GGAHGFLGVDRAVGLDVQDQLVQVGTLFDAGGLDFIGHAADRRERGIQHQAADRAGLFVRTATGGSRLVAETALDLQADVELGVLGQVRDHVVGVEDLDVVVGLDVGGGDDARAGLAQRQRRAFAGAHADRDVLEVEQDFEHVLLQAFDRAVFVQHAVDLDLGDREARDRGQQHAAQRVAQGVAIAALEGLDHDLRTVAGEAFDLGTTGAQDLVGGNSHIRSVSCRATASVDARPWTFGAPLLAAKGVARARARAGGVVAGATG